MLFVDGFLHDWGGVGMYLPSGRHGRLSRRDEEIYRQFSGSDFLALARKYDLPSARSVSLLPEAKLLTFRGVKGTCGGGLDS